jgi:hypothetical protein
MRSVLAMSLLIVLCNAASAATAHRTRHSHSPAVGRSGVEVNPRARFAVPGWSDEATRRWLDNASSNVGRGG